MNEFEQKPITAQERNHYEIGWFETYFNERLTLISEIETGYSFAQARDIDPLPKEEFDEAFFVQFFDDIRSIHTEYRHFASAIQNIDLTKESNSNQHDPNGESDIKIVDVIDDVNKFQELVAAFENNLVLKQRRAIDLLVHVITVITENLTNFSTPGQYWIIVDTLKIIHDYTVMTDDPHLLLISETLFENFTAHHPHTIQDSVLFELGNDDWKLQQTQHAMQQLFPNQDSILKEETFSKRAVTTDEFESFLITGKALQNGLEPVLLTFLTKQFDTYITNCITAWRTTTDTESQNTYWEIVQKNIETLSILWKEVGVQGIEVLHKKFGIHHFGRYSSHQLLAQARHEYEATPTQKYGILIYPFADHNGAFYQEISTLESVSEDIAETHCLVISEAKSWQDIMRRLITAQQQYGGDRKDSAEFVILGAHGEKHDMYFNDPKKATLKTEDFLGSRSQDGINRLIAPEAPIALISCSTGASKGVAEIAAEFFKRTITAPDVPTSLAALNIIVDKNRQVSIHPTFTEGTVMTHGPKKL